MVHICFFFFCVHVLFCSRTCSPMGVAKAKCTTHSFPPQCCHRRHHHRWPGPCLCRCQTRSLRPHRQKEVQLPPPHQVSMAETRRRSLMKLYALESTPKHSLSLHRLQWWAQVPSDGVTWVCGAKTRSKWTPLQVWKWLSVLVDKMV